MQTGTTDPGQKQKLRVDRQSDGNITLLKLAGTIDEQFDGKKIASGVKGGVLILELADIERISSFGIREWVDFITAVSSKVQGLWFVECAPKVVDQFNMVANFGGTGALVSFYAPYRCDYCDDDRRRLVQVAQEWEELRTGKLPERICESCGNAEYFDEDPLTFFSFLQSHPPVAVPADVAGFLASRLNYTADAGARKLKIEKAIDGRATYLKLSGDLDASFPREKIADGAEGDVIFDLGGIGKIDPAGAAEWRQMMLQIAAPSERIVIIGAPAAFVERLTKVEDLGQKGLILSFGMPYQCPTCRSTSAREVDVTQHWDVLKFATPPELKCPDCGSPTTCAASEALLAHLPSLPRPDIPDELRKQVKHFQEESLKKALAAKASGPAGATYVPGLPAAAAASGGKGGFSWMTALVAAGIVIVVAGAVIVAKGLAASRGGIDSGEKLEASQPTRPTWVDQTFFREADRLLFVGHSTLVADKADGFTEAEAGALEEVVNQIGLSIRDPIWIDHVRSQFEPFRQKAIGDLEKASIAGDAAEMERARRATREGRRRVGEGLKKTAGSLAPSERNDLYWEKLQTREGVKYKVSIRYAIPKANFEKLVESYSAPETAMGAKAVSYFPQLGWRYDVTEGAIITHVANDSNLRFAGIQEGDLILAGMDRAVHDARSWKRVLDEESAALTREGGTLVLKVKRGDAPAIDTRLRIARGGQASADSSNKLHQTKSRTTSGNTGSSGRTSKNQTGNIWDDNPEE
ncbi:MAG: Serine/threonine kinase family protein [Myxococcales bacterium]|nr:Serine/threonine kinase family protein [Myxococcales bacterium]